MTAPLVSVLVPVYNAGAHLRPCLDSVLAQTHRELEVIVIDDGSTDGSGSVCEEQAAADPRLRVHHQANAGTAAARNRALDLATGDFVAFVVDDDWLEPTMLATLLAAMTADVDLAICAVAVHHADGRAELQPSGRASGKLSRHTFVSLAADESDLQLTNSLWNKLYRRDLIERHGVRSRADIHFWNDLDFNLRYVRHCRALAYVATGAYHYRWHTANDTFAMGEPRRLTQELARATLIANVAEFDLERAERLRHDQAGRVSAALAADDPALREVARRLARDIPGLADRLTAPARPALSVIVPVYNAARHLDRCLRSLLTQTYRNLEVIAVDDGSTDGSGAIVDGYAARDSRVVAVHQANAGESAARNRGLELARGTFVAFVDDDDWLEPTMYGVLMAAMTDDLDAVLCGYDERYLATLNAYSSGVPAMTLAGTDLAAITIHGQPLSDRLTFMPWNRIWRRSVAQKSGARFVEKAAIGGDVAFNVEMLLHSRRVRLLANRLYHYERDNGGFCQTGSPLRKLTEFYAWQRVAAVVGVNTPLAERAWRHCALRLMELLRDNAVDLPDGRLWFRDRNLCRALAEVAAQVPDFADLAPDKRLYDAFVAYLAQPSAPVVPAPRHADPATLISVIVPMRNAAATLPRCLDSLREQSHANLEVILVDAGSTDGTPLLAAELAERDARVRLLPPADGKAAARNRALDAARGQFLAFLDPRDWLDAQMFARLLAAMPPDVDLAVCGVAVEHDDGRCELLPSDVMPGRLTAREFVASAARRNANCLTNPVGNKLYRRALVAQPGLRFPADIFCGDELWFNLRCVQRCRALAYVGDWLCHQRPEPVPSLRHRLTRGPVLGLLADLVADCPELLGLVRERQMRELLALLREATRDYASGCPEFIDRDLYAAIKAQAERIPDFRARLRDKRQFAALCRFLEAQP